MIFANFINKKLASEIYIKTLKKIRQTNRKMEKTHEPDT